MKKLLAVCAVVLGMGPLRLAFAESIAFPPLDFGSVKIFIPLTSANVSYHYDGVGKRSLVGAETPLAQLWKLQVTGGAITSLDGAGTPFVGVNYYMSNPIPSTALTGSIRDVIDQAKPGIFGGRDFNHNSWILGFKVSTNIF